MKFDQLSIHKTILKALCEMGYQSPTPIQQNAIPHVLAGRDLLGCAQTGTGKTCAFSVPIIQRLYERNEKSRAIRALILTPTRELALQIYENICQYARYTHVTSTVIFGGVSQIPQVDAIRHGADILIATPGRLWDLMGQGIVKLDHIDSFVLDEADRMLDMGFFPDVKRIVQKLPKQRQTLLFSATIPPEIATLADSLLHDPVRISVSPSARPVERIAQKVYFVEKADKRTLLCTLLKQTNTHQTLVFTRTKHGADRVARDLTRAGIKARAIHGDKTQNQRQAALNDFKNLKIAVLVATDIAARGIDINELPLVINFELPNIAETYVHRIGRTGRAGQEGTAISFCDQTERPYLRDIEKLTGCKIEVVGEYTPQEKQSLHHTANTRTLHTERTVENTHTKQSAPHRRTQGTASSGDTTHTRRERIAKQEQVVRSTASHTRSSTYGRHHNRGMHRRDLSDADAPRYDAHTPSRAYALSEDAAARIRRKVEAALARRASSAPVSTTDTAPTGRSTNGGHRRSGRRRSGRSNHKPS